MNLQMPRWNQLPEIALYMDQVLLVLTGILEPLNTENTPMVTATMINNYVKIKLSAPPVKKKYNREHLARFLMIFLMKKVFSMTEIAALRDQILVNGDLEETYNLFCQELELRMQNPDGPDSPGCSHVLATAVRAVACKLHVEKMLADKTV